MKQWWNEQFLLSTFEATGHTGAEQLEECKRRLKLTKDAGFELFEITWKNPECTQTILQGCEALGLPVILEDPFVAGKMSKPLYERNAESVEKLLEVYSKYNCIKGIYLWDEPAEEKIERCAELAVSLRQLNGELLPFFALVPSYGPYTFKNGKYPVYVNEFIDKVDPEVLSFDYYCFWQHCINNPVNRNPLWKDLGFWRKLSLEKGKPFWWYYQGINFGPRIPENESHLLITIGHFAFQMYSALCYGVKQLSCYQTYGSIIDLNGNPTHLYDGVVELNARVKSFGNELFTAKNKAVYHTGLRTEEENDYFLDEYENNPYFVSNTKQIIVSIFEKQGKMLYLVVNKNYKQNRNVEIHFHTKSPLKAFDDDVKIECDANGTYRFKLAQGQGILLTD